MPIDSSYPSCDCLLACLVNCVEESQVLTLMWNYVVNTDGCGGSKRSLSALVDERSSRRISSSAHDSATTPTRRCSLSVGMNSPDHLYI